jgi:hypothetical protein
VIGQNLFARPRQHAASAGRSLNLEWPRRPERHFPDAALILLVWVASASLSLFVEPHRGHASTYETLYFTMYNVAVGALVGFYLFDRLPKDGFALFASRACLAILCGTLLNETIIGPVAFGAPTLNGVSLYYALTDSVALAGCFLLIRLAASFYALQRHGDDPGQQPSRRAEDPDCLFVKAASGVRRIYARDVLYMQAERDFTRIVCANGEHFVSQSLKSLLDKSGDFGIARIHKSFAVNLNRVERLGRTQVEIGDSRVPVGRRYRPAFVERWRAHSAR